MRNRYNHGKNEHIRKTCTPYLVAFNQVISFKIGPNISRLFISLSSIHSGRGTGTGK